MIYFAQAQYLFLIFLIPVIFIGYAIARRIRRKRIARFGDPALVENLTPTASRRKGWVKLIFISLALLFFSIGMARPQLGAILKEKEIKGAEIMIVLDVSNSMLAEDYSPNRLERAKLAISKLVDELQGDRIGLIIFAGQSFVQLPITSDYVSAKIFLNSITNESVPVQGTALGEAIHTALRSFTSESENSRAVILITDGENHEDDPVSAAKDALSVGARVFCVGVGSFEGWRRGDVGPNLLIFTLTLLVEVVGGAVMWIPLLFWLAALSAAEFFFYSFAVCLGQFSGHILALPVYYGIFNFIVIAVYALLEWVMGVYYFGYNGQANYEGWVLWCTPAVAMFQVDIDVYQEEGSVLWHTDVERLWMAGVYAIAALVLVVCALLLYRRRHMETAGDIVAVKAMRPVFRYGVGFCAGMFLGFLTDQILIVGQLGMLIAIIVWGIIGCFVAQMLLDKTVRVFKKWKGCAALTVVFLLIFAVIGLDLTGYETRVPDPAAVESVEVNGLSGYPHDTGSNLNITLTDPESIEAVVAIHGKVVEFGEEGEPDRSGNYTHFKNLRLTYTLRSGAKISRRYSINLGPELMVLAQNLRNLDEVRYKTYELDRLEEFVAQGGKMDRTIIYKDGSGRGDVELSGDRGQVLWEAVMTDFANGNIGIHAMDTEEAEYFEKFGITEVGDIWYTATSIEFIWRRNIPRDELEAHDGGGAQYRHLQIQVMKDSVETLRVLEKLLETDNRYQDDTTDNSLWRTE